MKACGRESEIVQALREDAWAAELHRHVQSCAACAETERVARAVLASAQGVQAGMHLPDADMVWRRAQTRAKEAALRRATRPLRVMRILSLVFLAAFGVWAEQALRGPLAARFHAMGGWSGFMAGVTVSATWIVVLLLLIAAGTWCLWLADRRTDGAGDLRTAS